MSLKLHRLAALTSIISFGAAYLVPPPSTAASDTVSDCSAWWVVGATDTCASIAENSFITVAQFGSYNPSTAAVCKLVPGNSYCIEQNFGIPVTPSTPPAVSTPAPTATPTPTPTKTTPTTPTNGVKTPSPIQSGMVSNCDDFYFVKKDDGCENVANKYGITLNQLYAWNAAITAPCNGLWSEYYICVSIIGVNPIQSTLVTKTAAPTKITAFPACWYVSTKGEYVCEPTATRPLASTTKAPTGIATPTPIQDGMIKTCKKFYKVVKNDGCWAIATNNGITPDDFYKWNPAVGASCGGLIPDVYVCIGI